MAAISTGRALEWLALGGGLLAGCSKTADPERQAEPPSRVVMHYQAQIDPASHACEGDQDIWRLPPIGPKETVAVTAASQPGPWDRCDKPAKAAAVIMHRTVAQAD